MVDGIEPGDAALIDEGLAGLPELAHKRGMTFEQRVGYKAGKVSAKRNWCMFVDGNVKLPIQYPNRQGDPRTWKLQARFNPEHPPRDLWDRPEKYEYRKAQWGLASKKVDDVWGISYEDIKAWAAKFTSQQFLERLVGDLEVSFNYSRRRYKGKTT